MKHRIARFFAAWSFIVFATVVVLCIRSFWVSDRVTYGQTEGRALVIGPQRGRLVIRLAVISIPEDQARYVGFHYSAVTLPELSTRTEPERCRCSGLSGNLRTA